MEALFNELLRVIKQKSHLREHIHLAETLQGAKDLFIMACYADYFDAVGKHDYYGRLTDELVLEFYEFMKGKKV